MTFRLLPVAGLAALLVSASLTLAAGPSPDSVASAEAARGLLEQFGFFGEWALACDAPASPSNIVRRAYLSAAGEPGFRESFGPDRAVNEYRILTVKAGGSDRIVLDIELNGTTRQELTMIRDGDRVRTLGNRMEDGRVLVKDGTVAGTAFRTPWLTRCGN